MSLEKWSNFPDQGGIISGFAHFIRKRHPLSMLLKTDNFFTALAVENQGCFKFIEEYRQVPFLESVQIIADKTGMSLNIPPSQAVLASQHKHLITL